MANPTPLDELFIIENALGCKATMPRSWVPVRADATTGAHFDGKHEPTQDELSMVKGTMSATAAPPWGPFPRLVQTLHRRRGELRLSFTVHGSPATACSSRFVAPNEGRLGLAHVRT